MPTPRVIDISHHQTIPEDLLETKEAGIVGVIHKLTEGLSFTDSKVDARYYLAKQAGLAWGIYHFMRPGNMREQAAFFIDQAYNLGVIDENTVVVADHEDQGVSTEELKEFLDAVEEATERSPVVYSGHVLKEQLEGSGYKPKRRLWLAQYSSTPTLPDGVEKFWLWQYTDDGEIPGVLPPTDLNDIGDVSVEEFLAGWSGSYDQGTEPEPEPEAEVIINIDIEAPPGVAVKVNVNEGG